MSLFSKLFFWQNQQPGFSLFLRQYKNFDVYVNDRPIGGCRGRIGALWASHKDHKTFMEMNEKDLNDLSKLITKILRIFELNNVQNTLLYGRQIADTSFELNFIPYPKCSFYEKIQGAFHLIFGSPGLKQSQIDTISARLNDDALWNPQDQVLPNFVDDLNILDNPFRNDMILNNQRIVHIHPENFNPYAMNILHDNRPIGPGFDHPHFLVVPEGDLGKHDGSRVPIQLRTQMLLQAKKIMGALRIENRFTRYVYIQKIGDLRSVKHLHDHVIGIPSFPETFFQKIKALFRLILRPKLSVNDMQERINHYAPLM